VSNGLQLVRHKENDYQRNTLNQIWRLQEVNQVQSIVDIGKCQSQKYSMFQWSVILNVDRYGEGKGVSFGVEKREQGVRDCVNSYVNSNQEKEKKKREGKIKKKDHTRIHTF